MEAERKVTEMPVLLKTPAGYVQPSPWLAIANKQLERTLPEAIVGLRPETPPARKVLAEVGR